MWQTKLQIKAYYQGEENHYIRKKGVNLLWGQTVVNIYVPKDWASKHIKQKLLGRQGEIHSQLQSEILYCISIIDGTSREKISKDIEGLHCIIIWLNLPIHKTLYKSRIHILFMCTESIYQVDHIRVIKQASIYWSSLSHTKYILWAQRN